MNYFDQKSVMDYIAKNLAIDPVVNGNCVRDDQLIFIVSFNEDSLNHLISVDHKLVFNKVAQCPIHFTIPMVNDELKSLLKHLRTPKGARESATLDFKAKPFGRENRDYFFKND